MANSWKWKTKENVCEIRFTALVLLPGKNKTVQTKRRRDKDQSSIHTGPAAK